MGPRWRGGDKGEPAALASCYRRSLEIADGHGLTSVAFPAISQGIYGYPQDQATEIAVRTVHEALAGMPGMRVVFCCFDEASAERHRRALAGL